MTDQIRVVTPKCRAAFVHVFSPNKESDKYEITMVFDSVSDIAALKECVKKYCEEEGIPTKGLQMPWKSGDEKADKDEKYEWMRGKVVVGAKTLYQPKLVDQKKQEIFDQDEFYSGAYAKVVLSPYQWEYKKKKGIGFNPLAIQKVADGERLGSTFNPDAYFEEITETEVSYDL